MGKLLFFSILSYGHQNIGITLANHLLNQFGDQHEIYFAVDNVWKQRLEKINSRFRFKVYKNPMIEDNNDSDKDPMVDMANNIGPLAAMSPIEQLVHVFPNWEKIFSSLPKVEPEMDAILDELQPDLVITDQLSPMPFIVKRGTPWAMLVSANPLLFGMDELPSCMSGLRVDEREKWSEFNQIRDKMFEPFWNFLNDWHVNSGCPPLRPRYFMYASPYFNIYCYPKKLDYFESGKLQLPGKWLQLESAVSPSQEIKKLELPAEFLNLPGKLIYFSMGSTFSSCLDVMKRVIGLVGDIPHKFIVSKGSEGHLLDMPANCWGENFLDQKAVLNMVDLIISHGGNNTTIESFHFGVPMIILPLFADQHDNAARLEETGLGRRLKTFECTKEELLEAIDSILNNEQLIQTWKDIAAEIQSDNGIKAITDEILTYLNKNKS